MSDLGGKITMQNNQLIISSFKPKIVEMHTRDHLDRFREAAEATGVGLGWTKWRFSIEVGSKIYQELVKKNEISKARVNEIKNEMGLAAVVKVEPILWQVKCKCSKIWTIYQFWLQNWV